jgi:cytidine deaminase
MLKREFTEKTPLVRFYLHLNKETFFSNLRRTPTMNDQFHFIYRIFPSIAALSATDQMLIEQAKSAMQKAYAPYSAFKVGASLLLKSGLVIQGNNQENIAYPSGLCAERVALFYAGATHPNDSILKICIVAEGELTSTESYISPCGPCRQVMLESEGRQKENIEVILVQKTGKVLLLDSVQNLLPFGFSK